MSDEISPNEEVTEAVVPELTEEEKTRVATEMATAEAERLAAEEAACKEEKRKRAVEQIPRAHQLAEYAFLVPSARYMVDQILATLEPEAVEAGRAQVKAEQDELQRQLRSVIPVSSPAAVFETHRKPKRGR